MPVQPRSSFAVTKKLRPFYTGGRVEWDAEKSVVIAQSEDRVLKVSGATGEDVGVFVAEDDPVTTFALSPDRSFVVTSHKSGLLRQWRYEDGELVRSWKTFHTGPIPVLEFDVTSTLVVSGGSDSTLKVWDVVRQYSTHTLRGCQGVVSVATFHTFDDEIHVFAAATDNTIHGWHLLTSESTFNLSGHISTVTAIEASPDPNIIVSCARDGVVRIWNLSERQAVRAIAAMEALESLRFLPPGSFESVKMGEPYFVTGGARGDLRVWSLPGGKVVGKQEIGPRQLTPDGSQTSSTGPAIVQLSVSDTDVGHELNVVTFDNNLLTFDLPSFSLKGRLVGHNHEVLDARFVGKGDPFVAVASNTPIVKVYDVETTSCEFLEGHSEAVMTLGKWAKMPHIFASGSKDKSIIVWKYCKKSKESEGKKVWVKCAIGTGHTGSVNSLSCSKAVDGGKCWLASASEDTTIKLWKMGQVNTSKDEPGNCVQLSATFTEIAHDSPVNTICFSPNDALLATGSQDHTAKLWSFEDRTGLRLRGTFKGHRRGIWHVQFSPADQILATGSTDSTIRLWSIADFSCLKTFEGHSGSVLRVCFINAGTQVLTASADGLIKLWSVKTALCTSTLDQHEDKIWALDSNKKETQFVSGGSDANIIIWKDDTAEQLEKKTTEINERVEKEQLLANLLFDGKFFKALGLALSLEQPLKALMVIRAMMNSGSGNFDELEKTLKKLDTLQVGTLVRFLSSWNTNAKNYFPAQVVLNILLKQRPLEELSKTPGVAKALPGLISYSKKHKARLEKLRQASSFVRFIHETVKSTAGAGVSFTPGMFGMIDPAEIKEEPESDEERVVVSTAVSDDSSDSEDETNPTVKLQISSESEDTEDELQEPKIRLPRIVAPPVQSTSVEDMEGNLDIGPMKGMRVVFSDEEEDGRGGRRYDGGQYRRKTFNGRPSFGKRRNAF